MPSIAFWFDEFRMSMRGNRECRRTFICMQTAFFDEYMHFMNMNICIFDELRLFTWFFFFQINSKNVENYSNFWFLIFQGIDFHWSGFFNWVFWILVEFFSFLFVRIGSTVWTFHRILVEKEWNFQNNFFLTIFFFWFRRKLWFFSLLRSSSIFCCGDFQIFRFCVKHRQY